MYQVLIIGAGKIAAGYDTPQSSQILTHAHAYQKDAAFKLLGFYDCCFEKAKEAARRWGCKAYMSLGHVLQIADIVCCCVPDDAHAQVLRQVAEHPPKLVVAEKPLASAMEEARQIVQLYTQRHIPIVLNYSRRFQPQFQKLQKEIHTYGAFLKGIGYYGKGVLHNGSHMTDLLRFFFSKAAYVQTIQVEGHEEDPKEDPGKDAVFRIQDGTFYLLAVDSRIVTVFEMELLFEKARIRILDGGNVIEVYEVMPSEDYPGYRGYVLTKRIQVAESSAMTGLLENIKDFLEGKSKLCCTMQDGLEAMELCFQVRGEEH